MKALKDRLSSQPSHHSLDIAFSADAGKRPSTLYGDTIAVLAALPKSMNPARFMLVFTTNDENLVAAVNDAIHSIEARQATGEPCAPSAST